MSKSIDKELAEIDAKCRAQAQKSTWRVLGACALLALLTCAVVIPWEFMVARDLEKTGTREVRVVRTDFFEFHWDGVRGGEFCSGLREAKPLSFGHGSDIVNCAPHDPTAKTPGYIPWCLDCFD